VDARACAPRASADGCGCDHGRLVLVIVMAIVVPVRCSGLWPDGVWWCSCASVSVSRLPSTKQTAAASTKLRPALAHNHAAIAPTNGASAKIEPVRAVPIRRCARK